MIESSFILLDGVGNTLERRLWADDITSWEKFISSSSLPRISDKRKYAHDNMLRKAMANLSCRNDAFFAYHMPSNEHWRLYDKFKDSVAYLDIETTGHYAGNITTMVGIYDGNEFTTLIKGENLSKESIQKALDGKKMLVTFFGRGFDVPVLKREFGITPPALHVDLCFAGKRLGYRGGLKKIEAELGISRSDETCGLSGADAVHLWNAYAKHGNDAALDTLVKYNREDVINLETLANIIYPALTKHTMELF
ncbi:MAG: ribonuclease H-like domain-containing protein [Candidatus Methanofastidiosia archaeon]